MMFKKSLNEETESISSAELNDLKNYNVGEINM
jgi:hypothetical protein